MTFNFEEMNLWGFFEIENIVWCRECEPSSSI